MNSQNQCNAVAIVAIPVYNAEDTLMRAIESVMRQRSVETKVIVADHGSQDNSVKVAQKFACAHPKVIVMELGRGGRDRSTPARPLTAAFAKALEIPGPFDQSWVFRLDADDLLIDDFAIARQLRQGSWKRVISATIVFFDELGAYAYEYGPRPSQRRLDAIRLDGVYSMAHHATAIRRDLLRILLGGSSSAFDESLDFGEDLDFTCRLLRVVHEEDIVFLDRPYCLKSLGANTATERLSLRMLWASHVRLCFRHSELSAYGAMRGFLELALARLVGEQKSRVILQYVAGKNGRYENVDYDIVRNRLCEVSNLSAYRAER